MPNMAVEGSLLTAVLDVLKKEGQEIGFVFYPVGLELDYDITN